MLRNTPCKRLYQLFRLSRTNCLWLLYGQSLHEPGKLFPGNLLCFLRCSRPLVIPAGKTFVQKYKAIWFPQQGFYPVTASSAKQKQSCATWIHLVILLYDCSQSVDPPPHIRITTHQIYVSGLANISQHILTPETGLQQPDIPVLQ